MKKIVEKLPETEYVDIKNLYVNSLVGLEASGKKYVCVAYSGGGVAFCNGATRWDNDPSSMEKLLERAARDPRCTLYCFNNIAEFGAWLIK